MSMTMVVMAVAAILGIGLVLMLAMGGRRRARLQPLPAGARDRYAASWRAIEARFVDSPQEAIREADGLVASLSRERGISEDRMPGRTEMSPDGGPTETEDLRRLMVQRRKTVEDLLGADPRALRGRPEVVS